MTITVQELFNRVSDDIAQTISATSTDPPLSRTFRYYNRVVDMIGQICARYESDLAKTTQTIATVSGQAAYPDFKDILHATDKWAYIILPSSKSEIRLISERDSQGYGYVVGTYAQPEAFYIDGKNNIVFCSTPDAVYSIAVPFWKKFSPVSALTYPITGATKAKPCVLTTAFPGSTDDRIYIDSVVGMVQLNGSFYHMTDIAGGTTISLQNTDSTGYTAYGSGGIIYPCVPFNGIFDNLINSMLQIYLQNREEYDLTFEVNIMNMIQDNVLSVIGQRKKDFLLKARGYKG